MTTIAGFAEGILDGTIPPEKEGEALNVVVSETRRLSRLVRRMLDLSRLNALTETVTAQEQFDIIEVMSRVLVSLEGRITGRGLDVDAQFPEDPIMVWGDPDAVTQVCYNLLDNAAKFAAQGTDITVQITKKDGKALVTVRIWGQPSRRTSCHSSLNASTRRITPAAWTGRVWAWAYISSKPFWAI